MSTKMLDNGLVVLAKETPGRGLVTIDIKVLAGSSLEGRHLGSGVSHLVEHMLFKATKTRKAGEIEREVRALGGVTNGSVSPDLAEYHITVPVSSFPAAVALLKDMLQNALFDPTDIEEERQIIAKEIRLGRDDPQRRLLTLLNATAYRVHPYRLPVIGYEELLMKLTRDDAVDFYTRMYVPNRMVVTVAGDIAPATAIAAVKKEFGSFRLPDYGMTGELPREPLQIDTRIATGRFDTTLGYLALGFHSTPLTDEDLYALDILSMILGRGDTSRLNTELYKRQQLVHTIAAWNHTPRDPGLFAITAVAAPEKIDRVRGAVMAEIARLKEAPVSDEELEGARRTALADAIYSRETTEGIADSIGTDFILTGSPAFTDRYLAGLRAVTKDDIRRVARAYLTETNLTEVRLIPPAPEAPAQELTAPAAPERFERLALPNGITILAHSTRASGSAGSAAVTIAMPGGTASEGPGTNGISSMVSRMLFKGTKTRREDQILGAIQRMGGEADSFSGVSTFGFTIRCLSDSLDACLAIARDVVANPVFPQEELDKEIQLTLALISEEDNDLFQRGFNALRADLFPGSPYGYRYLGETETVGAFTRDMLVDYHKAHCLAGPMVVAVSGDVDAASLVERLGKLFGDVKRSPQAAGEQPVPHTPIATRSRTIDMPREESLILKGFRTPGLADPSRYPLDVAGSVLSGQSGRLFVELREKLSLAYALGCVRKSSRATGIFALYVATTKERTPEVQKALAEELYRIRRDAVGADELAAAQRELGTQHRLDMQSNEYISMNGALEELGGTGADGLFAYEAGIARVTADDVKRAADDYLNPDRRAEIVISPA